ncbi:MAG: ATPase, T2SS/T4P/T4SS family [Thermodesulfobacteriota bacterium]
MDETPGSDADVSVTSGFDKRFRRLVNAIHAAASPDGIMTALSDHILDDYHVEMASIYLVDAVKKQLVSWIVLPGNFLRKIRVPVDKRSIVGYCAATRSVVLVNNAYDREELEGIDPELRFDASWDRKAGSRTRQVLAAPILFQRSLMGVIQLMNRRDGRDFVENDRRHIADLAVTLGIAFRNLQQLSQRVASRYDTLVKNELITHRDLDRAFVLADRNREDVEQVLINEFHIRKEDLGRALADYYRTVYVDLAGVAPEAMEGFSGLNFDYLRKNRIAPLSRGGGKVVLAAADPHDRASLDEIQQVFGADLLEVRLALPGDIDAFLDRFSSRVRAAATKKKKELKPVPDIRVKRAGDSRVPTGMNVEGQDNAALLARRIIEDACLRNASDIHVEPQGKDRDAVVRYRIDGKCRKALTLPGGHVRSVVDHLKALAGLAVDESRRPQAGRIKYPAPGGKDILLRIATIPTADGNEDLVLHVLADSRPQVLHEIMPERIVRRYEELVRRTSGIILVAGPAGSGRTTTLHASLNHINTPEKKIWTAEDPMDITRDGPRQVPVNPMVGLTFSTALRAILRADPDVIMVGEMHDRETAIMVMEAAQSGRLVFGALQANSAAAAVARLIDLGTEPPALAAVLQGIIAQRLVRTLCRECCQAYLPEKNEFEHLKKISDGHLEEDADLPVAEGLTLYRPLGCAECNNTGYRGLVGLHELLVNDGELRRLISGQAPVERIENAAKAAGMTTLLQEGIRMVLAGRTDFPEVMRVCMG